MYSAFWSAQIHYSYFSVQQHTSVEIWKCLNIHLYCSSGYPSSYSNGLDQQWWAQNDYKLSNGTLNCFSYFWQLNSSHLRYIEVPSGHHVELTITDFEVISLLFHQSSSSTSSSSWSTLLNQTESCCDRLYITWDICQYGYWSYYKYYKGYQYTPVKLIKEMKSH